MPLEADGLDVDAFEAALAGGPVKLAHVIPNFHNPAGCTLSAAKRERLVELAAEHGFWIFEDDPYRAVRFAGEVLPTMLSMTERAASSTPRRSRRRSARASGSATSPAGRQIKTLAKRGSEHYISPNMLAESVVLELCRSGASPRTSSSSTARCASAATRSSRRSASRSPRPSSSSRAAATSCGSTSTTASTPRLLAAAKEEGVGFVAGPDFMLEGGESSLRLSFASVPADRSRRASQRLARALESQRASQPRLRLHSLPH